MTPEEFRDKWRNVEATERAAAQAHFIDLCRVLEVPSPFDIDPTGRDYAFEKKVTKPGGRTGFADVWKRGCFAWEYKGDRRNLVEAYSQLKDYADALENPPLLVVSDMKEIRVHTNFTSTPSVVHTIRLADLVDPRIRREILRPVFTDPDRLRPSETREGVTTRAAAAFGAIAQKLRSLGYEPRRVAHFLNKIVFCLFVEDIELLPERVFADILEESVKRRDDFAPMLRDLFRAMREERGRFGKVAIPWFNGGLFDDDDVLDLGDFEIRALAEIARLDWSYIDPSIFGTLFEKGLNPERRKEMASLFDAAGTDGEMPPTLPGLLDRGRPDTGVGIHYTDSATIMKLIEPVVLRPLRAEWETVKATIRDRRAAKERAKTPAAKTKAENEARAAYLAFRERLGKFRVLDPACGSGNFLYLALRELKDFDLAVLDEAKSLGLPPDEQRVTPAALLGIEINPYAAELARVTIWIGELQWQLRRGFGIRRRPILGQLKGIECRDALIGPDGKEAKWPKADAIVGNPPFLGVRRLRSNLPEDYVETLFAVYRDRVPAEADLVCYWFHHAGEALKRSRSGHAGLVATNSIRGGANRRVLQALRETLTIYEAWDDEPWVIDGAAVRVSLIAFAPAEIASAHTPKPHHDGEAVEEIYADLTARRGASGSDLTTAKRLSENRDVCFMGDTKGGAFDIPGDLARKWLQAPLNPNGCPNADVLRPWVNGMDVTRRARDMWIVDFGWTMSEEEAALYALPFAHCLEHIKPERDRNRREHYRKFWWRHVEPRPGMFRALESRARYVGTPTIAKYRLFVWFSVSVCPDHQIIVITRDDDTTFGILHSRFHELWALRMGTSLEDRPRYTPSTTFETFPFPEGLTPNVPAADYANDPRAQAIAAAAKRLDALRNAWLNPPDLVTRVPEVVPGYPDRILPVGAKAAAELKKRTLTNLYNARPTWLADAHRALDAAVAAAYGWPADFKDDDVLKRLLDLNRARASS